MREQSGRKGLFPYFNELIFQRERLLVHQVSLRVKDKRASMA
jgi:hypothetical protein